jgi:hypothetical protein
MFPVFEKKLQASASGLVYSTTKFDLRKKNFESEKAVSGK